MARRERARRPPPAPEDIRRQLGWKLAPCDSTYALIEFYLLPATLGRLAAQAALEFCLRPLHTSKRLS